MQCIVVSILFAVALVGFAMPNITVQESSGEVTFRVLKIGIAAIPLTVLFTTEDLQAIGNDNFCTLYCTGLQVYYDSLIAAPLDYTGAVKEITFEPSEAEKLITVEILNDGIFEGKEAFTAKLAAVSSNVQIGAYVESLAIILDEDDGM